jgi:hypothetical protein
MAAELRTFAGCLWHTVRRRCENGLVMAAHAAGRIRAVGLESRAGSAGFQGSRGAAGLTGDASEHRDTLDRGDRLDDFLSGRSGTVGGRRELLRGAADLVLDGQLQLGRWLDARRPPGRGPDPGERPARRVLVLTIARPAHRDAVRRAAAELEGSAHDVTIDSAPAGELGKFENLNALLDRHRLADYDWLLVADDDVELPRGFLDRFLALAERHELVLAQPAHRLRSHAAWRLTRRRPAALVRETRFVEIGPVTLLHPATFDVLLPFPQLRMGWGLDAHWAALAAEHGWRLGIVDATPIAHLVQPAGDAYSREQALAEARAFLTDHDYMPAAESQRTLAVHRRCA